MSCDGTASVSPMQGSAAGVAKSETISEYEQHLDDAYGGLADRIQGQETQLTAEEFEAVTLASITEYDGEGTEKGRRTVQRFRMRMSRRSTPR